MASILKAEQILRIEISSKNKANLDFFSNMH